ncbi:right-handed parallel beta-helix repeat-containing protein [Haloplasma contractile]|uniref:Cell wall surface anchor family protein n=1 Tax=Haloplasma contractile SSD-17B TaxID=1033810 RepID=U2DR85_9MOLU|nr:right-handed parallel beta-helix repeat-containing protein [Haloplasma contractile]ERJ11087.1 cell wall surface anchor family protein [Haloplasma contractile SSD-17B]
MKLNVSRNRKILFILITFVLAFGFMFANSVTSDAEGNFLYVDPSDNTSYSTILDAYNTASDGDIIYVTEGNYELPIIEITKSVTIKGSDKEAVTIRPTADTSSREGWITVLVGATLNLDNVTLDGDGFSIYYGILGQGTINVENTRMMNIKSGKYLGIALRLESGGLIENNYFEQIGRIGIYVSGPMVNDSIIINNTYTGKGDGDWIDYGIEVGRDGHAFIKGNHIFNNTGVAASDGSGSAGILVSSYYGTGPSTAIIDSGNIIENNTIGIGIGYTADDSSDVTIENNIIRSNEYSIVNYGSKLIQAERNYFGTGLERPLNTYGNIDYFPWAVNEERTLFTNNSVDTVVVDDDFINLTTYDHVQVDTDGDGVVEDYYYGVNAFSTVPEAVATAVEGSLVHIEAGSYRLEKTLRIEKGIMLRGVGENLVTLDASDRTGWGILVDQTNVNPVELSGFTLDGANTPNYGIHASGTDGLIIHDITVQNFGEWSTGIDLNTVNNTTLTNVTSINNGGNGINLMNARNVTLDTIMTSGNAWSGIGIMTGKAYFYGHEGTQNVVLKNIEGVTEGIYLEDGNHPDYTVPISYSLNLEDGADVTILSDTIQFAYYGIRDKDTTKELFHTMFFTNLEDAKAMDTSDRYTHVYLNDMTSNTYIVDEQFSLEDAYRVALDGDRIYLTAGTYTLNGTFNINKEISIIGEGTDVVAINYEGTTGYGIKVEASNVELSNFTLNTPNTNSYPVKVQYDHTAGEKVSNINVNTIIVNNNAVSGRTGIDFNGVTNSAIMDVEVYNSGYGNGISLTNSSDITITNVTTSGNAWGGIAVYTKENIDITPGSNNVTIDGVINIAEKNQIYTGEGNGYATTNLTLPVEFDYLVNFAGDSQNYYVNSVEHALLWAQEVAIFGVNATVYEISQDIYYLAEGMDILYTVEQVPEYSFVVLMPGTYTLNSTLTIDKSIGLIGVGSDLVTINYEGPVSGYGMLVESSDVYISGFTFNTPTIELYPFKVQYDQATGTKIGEVMIDGVIINNNPEAGKTGIDFNGVSNSFISNVQVYNSGKGNGIAVTDSNNIYISNVTTSGNAWGGIAIYAAGKYDIPAGTDSIIIEGTNNLSEANQIYTGTGFGTTITNVSVPAEYNYTVLIPGSDSVSYQDSIEGAVALAQSWITKYGVNPIVKSETTAEYYVGEGMDLQQTIDVAEEGATVHLLAGTHRIASTLTIDKGIHLIGEGQDVVTLDASNRNGWGIHLKNSNTSEIELAGFTLIGTNNSNYGIHTGGTQNFSIHDITVKDFSASGIDLNTASIGLVENVTAINNNGNGIQLANAYDVTLRNITTSGNVWAGIGMFTNDPYYYGHEGIDNIILENIDNVSDGIYLEDGNHSEYLVPITYSYDLNDNANVTLLSNKHQIVFDGVRSDGLHQTLFLNNLDDAMTAASMYAKSHYIKDYANNAYHVVEGMSIQRAIDLSEAGDTIYVYPGHYVERSTYDGSDLGLWVNKDDISIIGLDENGTEITDPNNVQATIEAFVQSNWGTNFYITSDNVTIKGLRFVGTESPWQAFVNKVIEVTGNNFTLEASQVDGVEGLYLCGAVYVGDNAATDEDLTTFVSGIGQLNINNNILFGSVSVNNGVGYNTENPQLMIINNVFDDSNQAITYITGVGHSGFDSEAAWRNAPSVLPTVTGNTFNSTASYVLVSYDDDPSRVADLAYIEAFIANNTLQSYTYILNSEEELKYSYIWTNLEQALEYTDVADYVVYSHGSQEMLTQIGSVEFNSLPDYLASNEALLINVESSLNLETVDIYTNINNEGWNVSNGQLLFDKEGDYSLQVKSVDTDGNELIVYNGMISIDFTPPTLTGVEDLFIEVNTVDVNWLEGISANDTLSRMKAIQVDTSNVDLKSKGTYTVTYTVEDFVGNITTETITVTVQDTIAPEITVIEHPTFEIGTTEPNWLDYVTASDLYDQDVTITHDAALVDMNTVGVFTVTVTATDDAGNEATETITVTIKDTIAPVITGHADMTLEIGTIAKDWLDGVSATDNSGEIITVTVDETNVDMNTVETFEITYTATDSEGNVATETVTITIEDTTAPVITGHVDQTFEIGTIAKDWLDGVTATDNSGETIHSNSR